MPGALLPRHLMTALCTACSCWPVCRQQLLLQVRRDLPGTGRSPDLGRRSRPAQLLATAKSGPAHPPARSRPAPEGPCPLRPSAAAPRARSLLAAWCCWALKACRLQLAAYTDRGMLSGTRTVDSKRPTCTANTQLSPHSTALHHAELLSCTKLSQSTVQCS